MNATPSTHHRPFAALQQFARKRQRPAPCCQLCSAALAPEHRHLIEPETRQLVCSCEPCAFLFPNQPDRKYRRIPRDVRSLANFQLSDARWEGLLIPINMAFFFYTSPDQRIVALYPSPAGAVESLLDLDTWDDIVRGNPLLEKMEPDVEALLVNRLAYTTGHRSVDYYLAPIDKCYELVGLIRAHWRGLSGGTEVWRSIDSFFNVLKGQAKCLS